MGLLDTTAKSIGSTKSYYVDLVVPCPGRSFSRRGIDDARSSFTLPPTGLRSRADTYGCAFYLYFAKAV